MLNAKTCHNCNKSNKPNAQFCSNLNYTMILSYSAYTETLDKQKERDEKIMELTG